MQALAGDLGWTVKVRVWTDSSAAKAVANRRGLGKLRHVELKWLWMQDMFKEGRIQLKTVRGDEHVADLSIIPICGGRRTGARRPR